MDNFQRAGSISNAHAGRDFTAKVKIYFASKGLQLTEEFALPIGFKSKKLHKFDLGSTNPQVIIECKSYTWTSGGNSPSAKIMGLNEAMLLFSVSPIGWRKVLVMLRHLRDNQSLAESYVRTKGHLIGHDVEILEFDENLGSMRRLV